MACNPTAKRVEWLTRSQYLKGAFQVTTQLELDNRLAAESRLISMGLRAPLPPPLPGELPWEVRIEGSAERASKARLKRLAQGLDREPQTPLAKT